MSLTNLSNCARDCAERGLFKCQLDQPDCVCVSASWFNIFRPCVIDACPFDELESTLDTTLEACDSIYDLPKGAYVRDFEDAVREKIVRDTPSSSTSTSSSATPTNTPSPTNSSSPTSTPDPPSNSGSSLSPGAIAGIAIGSALIVLLAAVGVFLLRRRSKRRSSLFKQPASTQFGDKWVPSSPISPTQPYSPAAIGKPTGPRMSGSTIGEGPAVHTVPGPQELPTTNVIVEVEDPNATALAVANEKEANEAKGRKSHDSRVSATGL